MHTLVANSPPPLGLLQFGKRSKLLKRGDFSEEEEDLKVKLHGLLGNRWSLIAGRLPGQTNEIKNGWNFHLRRKLASLGIDPHNHRVNQRLLPSHRHQNSQKTMKSSNSRNQKLNDSSNNDDDDSLLDAENCMEDLNLELIISLPSDPGEIEEKKELEILN